MNQLQQNRILYIGQIPPEQGGTAPGGVASHCWDLARWTAGRGYPVYLLTPTARDAFSDDFTLIARPDRNKTGQALLGAAAWIRRGQLHQLEPLGFRERLYVFRSTYYLQKIIGKIRPRLIHLHSFHNLDGWGIKLLFPSIPLVMMDHGFWQGISGDRDIQKIQPLIGSADWIIFPSCWARRKFGTHGLRSRARHKVIFYPQDPEKLPLLDREKLKRKMCFGDKKVLLFSGVGEPVRRKGLDILLAAVDGDAYLKQTCKVVIITNKEGVEFAGGFAGRSDLDLVILGPQPWNRIVEYFNSADLFVMPSRSESFGIVYTESLLSGTPVIGFAPIIEELENLLKSRIGERFDAGLETETDLAEKIKRILQSDYQREQLRNQVIKHLSWSVLFPEFETVYRSLMKNTFGNNHAAA